MKPGRNEPCPCGSGKKYKKCCLAKDEAAASQESVLTAPSGREYATNAPRGRAPRPEAAHWPVVRALVPRPSVWRTTGLGSAGVVRQQPDGRYAAAVFMLNLEEHGLQGVYGKDDASLAEAEELIEGMAGLIPPWQAGTVEEASEYAWGAQALCEAQGYGLPFEQLAHYFELMAPPVRSQSRAIERLVGPRGLTPPELVSLIEENPTPDDLPEGKALAIITEITFDLRDVAEAERTLARHPLEFVRDVSATGPTAAFTWRPTRDEGRGRVGARKTQGAVQVVSGALVATTGTLSMGARLVATLEDLLGESIRVRQARWRTAHEQFAGLDGRTALLLPSGG